MNEFMHVCMYACVYALSVDIHHQSLLLPYTYLSPRTISMKAASIYQHESYITWPNWRYIYTQHSEDEYFHTLYNTQWHIISEHIYIITLSCGILYIYVYLHIGYVVIIRITYSIELCRHFLYNTHSHIICWPIYRHILLCIFGCIYLSMPVFICMYAVRVPMWVRTRVWNRCN